MLLTITRKLTLGVGVLLTMLILLGAFSYVQTERLNRQLVHLIGHQEPVSAAGYEMEINLIGTGFGALAYLNEPSPQHLRRIRKDANDFASFQERYHAGADNDRERVFAARIEAGYERFKNIAERLTQRHDLENDRRTRLRRELEAIEHALEARIEDDVSAAPQLAEQIRLGLRMEEFVIQAGWTALDVQAGDVRGAREMAHDFSRTAARYRAQVATDGDWTLHLEGEFMHIVALAEELGQLNMAQSAELKELIVLRESLDELLDDELQVQAREELGRAQTAAQRLSEQTLTGLALTVPLALVIGVGGGWLTARSILQPLSQLLTATQTVARGKLGLRLQLTSGDEFVKLGQAFNHMVEQLQHNLVARSYVEAMLEAMSEALFVVCPNGTIRRVNAAACQWLGYTETELLGRPFSQVCPDARAVLVPGGLSGGVEIDFLSQGGDTIPVSISAGQLREHQDAPADWVLLAQDISERKRLQQELLTIADRERMRSGQELHDNLGQHLTGVAFLAKVLERKLQDIGVNETEDAAWVVRLVNEAVQRIRGLARGLHPVGLEASGLGPALEQLAADTAKLYGIDCEYRDGDGGPVLSTATANHLYRIAQEALNNALKHGHASHIRIELSTRRAKIRLLVADDGTGFDPRQPVKQPAMGLQSMRLRAAGLRAVLRIRSRPGNTQVLVVLPARTPVVEPAVEEA